VLRATVISEIPNFIRIDTSEVRENTGAQKNRLHFAIIMFC